MTLIIIPIPKLSPRIALGQDIMEPEAEVMDGEIICSCRQCVRTVMSSQDMPKQASKQTLIMYKHV